MYDRKEQESFIDYAVRLLDNRVEYELGYSEIYELLFGDRFSTDECRKRLYLLPTLIEKLKEEQVSLNDVDYFELEMQKLTNREMRLKINEQKVFAQRNHVNKLLRETARKEFILDELEGAISEVKQIEFKPLRKSVIDKEYVLCLSDMHFDSNFDIESNSYSIDICKQRLDNILGEIIDMDITKIKILNTADDIQGLLHLGDLKKAEIGLVKSVVQVSRMMADWLNAISEFMEVEYYPVGKANHSEVRIFNKERSYDNEDLTYIINNYISDLLKDNKRVTINLPKEDYQELNILGYDIFAIHGHQYKSPKQGYQKILNAYDKKYTTVIMGHFHTFTIETMGTYHNIDCNLITLPSIIGTDPYAESLGYSSQPSVILLTYNKKDGLSEIKQIKL